MISGANRLYRGAMLRPVDDARCLFLADAAVVVGQDGRIMFAGAWREYEQAAGGAGVAAERVGLMLPVFVDAHLHLPQHKLRGKFDAGVRGDDPRGILLASLQDNIYPAERASQIEETAYQQVASFHAQTISCGTAGGLAWMTSSTRATEIALQQLPESWRVALVLMDQNCPDYLKTDKEELEAEVTRLARGYGLRLVLAPRFAVSCSMGLMKLAAELAHKHHLHLTTHMCEQPTEWEAVARFHAGFGHYAGVYEAAGLLTLAKKSDVSVSGRGFQSRCIMAHCVQNTAQDWQSLSRAGAAVAHCPSSNFFLRSGVMNLVACQKAGVDWAVCSDVAAGPEVNLLGEMAAFAAAQLAAGSEASAGELLTMALYRCTVAPSKLLELHRQVGGLAEGDLASFVAIELPDGMEAGKLTSAQMVLEGLLPQVKQWCGKGVAATGYQPGAVSVETLMELRAWMTSQVLGRVPKVSRVVVCGSEVYAA